MQCRKCGGEMKLTELGVYQCKYCGYEDTGVTSAPVLTASTGDAGADLYENVVGSVLQIRWYINTPAGRAVCSGSGYLITQDGYAVTNTHVVVGEDYKAASELEIIVNDQQVKAKVICLGDNKGGDGKGEDLAIIKLDKVPKGAKPVAFENYDKVKNGQKIYILGNPAGMGMSITSGIVSDRLRDVYGKPRMLTDCTVNGGNSGGPVFNEAGNVIGTVVAKLSNREAMNLVIPNPVVIDFLNKNKQRFNRA